VRVFALDVPGTGDTVACVEQAAERLQR
jgi:hypothetical protein